LAPARCLAIAIAIAMALAATAMPAYSQQPATRTPAAADPAEATVVVPRLAYRSAFRQHRPWADQPVGDWRALNDEVTRIGGWRSYLREAQLPEPVPGPGPTPTPMPMPAPMPTPTPTPAPAPAHHHPHQGPSHHAPR